VTRLAALFLLLISFTVSANEAQPTEQDPVAAARAVTLANELRCLVCQNQSIAESNAELAVDLRRQIKEQIAAGKSDGEIVNFMVQRYGDFVLYRPPLRGTTLLLWSGPALLLVVGLAVLVFSVRKRQRQIVDQPLSEEEHRQAERLLAGGSEKKPT
jgi:cytochrome c-type biogenesis protein CcmH